MQLLEKYFFCLEIWSWNVSTFMFPPSTIYHVPFCLNFISHKAPSPYIEEKDCNLLQKIPAYQGEWRNNGNISLLKYSSCEAWQQSMIFMTELSWKNVDYLVSICNFSYVCYAKSDWWRLCQCRILIIHFLIQIWQAKTKR